MGGSSWSDDAARSTYSVRSAYTPHAMVNNVFTNTRDRVLDESLDPSKFKIRESRDSDAHPESNAIAIFFDVTGSMGGIPMQLAKDRLPGLMRMLLANNSIQHPQILFGAVGDAWTDQAPLQIGQFESGIEMDLWLTKMFLEGGGGGQNKESYDMALYWASRHVEMDCLQKRGKKGYLFLIGDESYYPSVSKNHVKRVIGDDLEQDIPIAEILAEAQEKYEVFFVSVASESYRDGHLPDWRKLMGERALFLENTDNVCEFIAGQIALMEGLTVDDIGKGLKDAGLDSHAIDNVTKALQRSPKGAVVKSGKVTGDLNGLDAPGGVTR